MICIFCWTQTPNVPKRLGKTGKSNLLWIFIMLNLHQLTDSKAQLNINKVSNIARSYRRRCRGAKKAIETIQSISERIMFIHSNAC